MNFCISASGLLAGTGTSLSGNTPGGGGLIAGAFNFAFAGASSYFGAGGLLGAFGCCGACSSWDFVGTAGSGEFSSSLSAAFGLSNSELVSFAGANNLNAE